MGQATESAIKATENYISNIDVFGEWYYGYCFEEISYSKTAAKEILKLLHTDTENAPLDILENFRNKMGRLSLLNVHTKDIFAVAYVTAENIIDNLIS